MALGPALYGCGGSPGGSETTTTASNPAAQEQTTASQLTTTTAPTGEPPAAGPTNPAEATSLEQLVGQRFMVAMQSSATSALLREVREGRVGGVIIFPAEGAADSEVRAAIAQVRAAARAGGVPPPLVATDQEGGIVKRFPQGPPFTSAPQLGANGDPAAAASAGADTGRFLRELGIDVDLAPVLDVPESSRDFIASRAFGQDPDTVTTIGGAFARGLRSGGVAATAKHFPGLGLATVNTDEATSVIGASAAELRSGLEPFERAIDSGVELVMVNSAIYPALGSEKPAAWSPQIVEGLLRDRLGFGGVVITDDLESPAVSAVATPAQAAVASLTAGADIALFAQDPTPATAAYRMLLEKAREGSIPRSDLRASYQRIVSLKRELANRVR